MKISIQLQVLLGPFLKAYPYIDQDIQEWTK